MTGAGGTGPARRGRPPKMTPEDLREKILDAAVVAFADQGVRGVNLEDLATGVGITKPTIYKAFKSKEAVFVAAIEREVSRMTNKAIDSWAGTAEMGLGERTRERLTRYFQEAQDRPHAMRLLLTATDTGVPGVREMLEESRQHAIASLAQLIRDDLEKLGIVGGPSVELLAGGLVEMTVATALRTFEDKDLPADAVIDLLAAFYTGGFAAAAGGPMQEADERFGGSRP